MRVTAAMKKNALGLVVCAITAGCGTPIVREVTTTRALHRDNVDCHWRQVIWESSDSGRGCDVTVTYRGSESCPARLLTISSTHPSTHPGSPPLQLTPGQVTEPAGPAGRTVKLRDVQTIWLACGDQNGERDPNGCSYQINRIVSSLDADVLNTVTVNAASLTNFAVTCGTPTQTIWEAPPGQPPWKGCHVTVRVKGTGHCQGILEYIDARKGPRSLQSRWTGDLVTLMNVKKIRFRCGGPGESGQGQCTCEIVQIDCPK